jgi:excisionase family DNA binding protein
LSKPTHTSPFCDRGRVAGYGRATPQVRAAWQVNEFCRLVGISRTSFYKAVKNGTIRVSKIAGRTLISSDEVARLLDQTSAPTLSHDASSEVLPPRETKIGEA